MTAYGCRMEYAGYYLHIDESEESFAGGGFDKLSRQTPYRWSKLFGKIMIYGLCWWYKYTKNSSIMDKITLSLHNAALKHQIKKYAKKRGITVLSIVESYLHNLIKTERRTASKEYGLPKELDSLLDGIDVSEKLQAADYKTLRDKMYENREK